MTQRKGRLTITVDRALIRAGSDAVTAGRADSLSGWVNLAMAERAEKDERLRAMSEALTAYEAEFGAISTAEMAAQARADARSAVVVRGSKAGRARRTGRAGS
jgi:hypothetical protein